MEETCTEVSSLVTQTGSNQREASLTGKRDEPWLELKANKLTLHTCICCVSLPLDVCGSLCQFLKCLTFRSERGSASILWVSGPPGVDG